MPKTNKSTHKENISLKTIAKALGLSTSTVSRALNDNWEISEGVKAKVVEYANSIGYRPNIAAKMLFKGSSDFIAIVVPNITDPFFSSIVDAMISTIEKRGYRPVLLISHESLKSEIKCISNVLDLRVQGVLICLTQQTRHYKHLLALKESLIPTCFFDRIPNVSEEVYNVVEDNYCASFRLTNILIKRGCKNITFIIGPSYLNISEQRKQGFLDAMSKAKLEVHPHNIIEYRLDSHSEKHIEKLLSNNKELDATICISSRIMSMILRIQKRSEHQHLKHNIVTGFTNNIFANLVEGNIPFIYPDTKKIGVTAATKVIDLIEKKDVNKTDIIKSRLR